MTVKCLPRAAGSKPRGPGQTRPAAGFAPVAFVFLLALLGGCAGQTIDRTAAFADAAIAFEKQLPPISDAAFGVMVEADSLVLVEAREPLTRAERREEIRVANEDLRDIHASLRSFDRMAAELQGFFVELKSLATQDDSATIGEAVNTTVGQIDRLAMRLAGTGLIPEKGGDTVKSITNAGTAFVVRNVQSVGLRKILDAHGKAINSALLAQEGFLAALGDWMNEDGDLLLKARERKVVIDPFVSSGSLPADWAQRRRAPLTARTNMDGVVEAQLAARKVRAAFQALGENRLDPAHIQGIVDDLGRLATAAEGISQLTSGGKP